MLARLGCWLFGLHEYGNSRDTQWGREITCHYCTATIRYTNGAHL